MVSKYLQDLKQYHFDRSVFTDTFSKVFEDGCFDVEEACISGKSFNDFLLYYSPLEEFYIIHLPSGTIINWYKHLGRTNTCNKEGFGVDDLTELLRALKDEMDKESEV